MSKNRVYKVGSARLVVPKLCTLEKNAVETHKEFCHIGNTSEESWKRYYGRFRSAKGQFVKRKVDNT